MQGSLKLGRLGGIEIGVHCSWLFAFALIAWSLAVGYYPARYRDWTPSTYWLLGTLSAFGLFASVLIHEPSHSFVALARGHGVRGITLFIFGGVSQLVLEDGRLAGIVSITDAKEVPQAAWATTPVADVMTRPPLKIVSADTPLDEALRLLVGSSLNQLPVVERDRPVGLLGRADVLCLLQLRATLGPTIARR